jgi:hypothetical protein
VNLLPEATNMRPSPLPGSGWRAMLIAALILATILTANLQLAAF